MRFGGYWKVTVSGCRGLQQRKAWGRGRQNIYSLGSATSTSCWEDERFHPELMSLDKAAGCLFKHTVTSSLETEEAA